VSSVELRLVLDDGQLAAIRDALPPVDAAPAVEPWPEWMNAQTASGYLDITVERLRKLKERGRIPFYQEGPGCRVFFKRTDLDAWMEKHRRGGDAQTAAAD
jgi:excisionase family DNA binding protein